jgi:inward rectifier potassium channel
MAKPDPRRDIQSNVVRTGVRRAWGGDLYAEALKASWLALGMFVVGFYAITNALFAGLYLLGGDDIANARPGSFQDAYFFSVQTLATIGYGGMTPQGLYGNVLVAIESLVGLVAVAIMTGLVFARFSRPTARILWAERAVIARRNGIPTLQLRLANERGNNVIEARIAVGILLNEVSAEGERMRRMYDLKLIRDNSPLFTLSFTGMHVIDEKSPLYGLDAKKMQEEDVRIFLNLTGLDATFAQTIHSTHLYLPEDIDWEARYVDVMDRKPDGSLTLRLEKFHLTEAVATVPSPAAAPPS